MQKIINIKGMHCPACRALIEDICRDNQDIESCSVDFKTGQTIINHHENINWDSFKKEIEESGDYQVIMDN